MTPGLIERLEAAGEHTPGPWVVIPARPHEEIDGAYEAFAGIEGADGSPVCVFGDASGSATMFENAADYALIAAAPDLLEALIEALPYVESCEYDNGYKPGAVAKVVRNMNAAILKARATQEQTHG